MSQHKCPLKYSQAQLTVDVHELERLVTEALEAVGKGHLAKRSSWKREWQVLLSECFKSQKNDSSTPSHTAFGQLKRVQSHGGIPWSFRGAFCSDTDGHFR